MNIPFLGSSTFSALAKVLAVLLYATKDGEGPCNLRDILGAWSASTLVVMSSGHDIANRVDTLSGEGDRARVSVAASGTSGATAPRQSTATPSVSILAPNFPMPQLGRTRRIWLYLPPDYAASTNAYPVLYMHDGQNVFDEATSFGGEWGVDETLDRLQQQGDGGCIVVAIDNDGAHRMAEYQPNFESPDGGEGGRYVDFITQTLKPYVDKNFRTRPDRLHTGIAGSSLGGLISLYAALKYPDVFGRVVVFSAPLWLQPRIFDLARRAVPLAPATHFYFLCGLKEATGTNFVWKAQQQMVETLASAGFKTDTDVRQLALADGQHSEWFWRREFPAAYKWLFNPWSESDPAHMAASSKKPQPWPHGIIPYDVSRLTAEQQALARRAMQRWMDTGARLSFVPRSNEKEYVYFTGKTDEGNNTSQVGFRPGTRSEINITAFWWRQQEWMPAHELGHVLGFFHEHERWDRDDYVTIHYENIKPGRAPDYDWIPRTNWIVNSTAYDYRSIMHYRTCWASKCESECHDGDGSGPCAVIDPLATNYDAVIGQWGDNGISAGDAEKARWVYGTKNGFTP